MPYRSTAVRRELLMATALVAFAANACALRHGAFEPGSGGPDATRPDRVVPDGRADAPDVPGDTPPDGPCAAGQQLCSGTCTPTGTDPMNCGACAHACPAAARCEAGACVCPGGQSECAGRCVTTGTDPMNCGMCGRACAAGQLCSGGTCATSCGPLTLCPGERCADLQTDPMNCGMCGRACEVGQSCAAGACACPMGQMLCSGRCVNTANDPMNCGTCGRACGAPTGGSAVCAAGACTGACPAGSHLCGGPTGSGGALRCASDTSVSECGPTCTPCSTTVMGATPACVSNACSSMCPAGTRLCPGSPGRCAANNNGACGPMCTPCVPPANGMTMCDGTSCVPRCNPGYVLSGGVCTQCGNGQIDGAEACDDGNTSPGDGCSAACAMEPGAYTDWCETPGRVVITVRRGATQRYRGSTRGAADNGMLCGANGSDVLFEVRAASTGTLSVMVVPFGGWNVVARYGYTCPGGACQDNGGGGTPEMYTLPILMGATSFHVVDGSNPSESGDFEISFTLM